MIAERVVDLVGNGTQGLLCSYVGEEYQRRFRQSLPANWLDVVCRLTDRLVVQEMAGRLALFPARDEDRACLAKPQPALPPDDNVWVVHVLAALAADRVRLITCSLFVPFCGSGQSSKGLFLLCLRFPRG